MGRKQPKWKEEPEQREDYNAHGGRGGPSWHVWPGAWGTSPKPAYEVRYDQMPLQGKGSKKETLTLTQARKADGKVRKLAEEEAQKRKQFAAYAAMMKQAFNQNQKQFAKDMARIAEERKVAETIGLNAARSVLQGRQSPMEVEAPTETSAWHALLTRAPEEEEPQDGYYAAAMLALQQAAASSAVASRPPAPPFTPPGRMLPLKPMTPMPTPRDFAAMAAAMYGSQAMADPYQVSPNMS